MARPGSGRRVRGAALGATALAMVVAAGCGTSAPSPGGDETATAGGKLEVVATIDAWGGIAAALGGDKVHETGIITNPDTDPHDYEPTPADARAVAGAKVVIANGIGYDAWADRLLAASPGKDRVELNIGKQLNVPADGNPHQWYSPAAVAAVADLVTANYKRADPADAAYFDQRHDRFVSGDLARYQALIAEIRQKYAGTPVGASESIVEPLAQALGLNLVTPEAFLKAISEGTDPSPADKAAIDAQITAKALKVYIFNSQNSTPDVQAQVDAAKRAGIEVTTVTETPAPAGATFQDWQTGQLQALADALHRATGA
ncbi:metal ABC transporter solute-binding protein, Zn/Mn family [Nocardia aurantia]|uniref:ABC transporter substrate-binding protein n=1 Tax=Nocardia aurantia TaxID=2585199 RepID=A0A7K0DGK2_9NOCA|nr:zinc ABC transporter substrate-binding protein [Nocardia aurantia]MQY24799.1 hypothetical protein [Nocardia aurantia]